MSERDIDPPQLRREARFEIFQRYQEQQQKQAKPGA